MAGLAGGLLAASSAQAVPVVLYLRSGDRVSGEIVAESPERITLQSPSLGRIRILQTEIEHRTAPGAPAPGIAVSAPATPTILAPTAPVPKPVVTAAPAAAPKSATSTTGPGAVASATSTPPAPVPPPSLWWLPGWVRPLTTNWHGNVQLGMDLGFGTTDRQTFYANATLNHAYDRFRNLVTLRSAYGVAEGPVSVLMPQGNVQTANSLEGLLKTDFDLGVRRKIYLYHQTGAGFDEIRRYNLRVEDGAGLGYKLIDTPRLSLNTEAGGQYQHFAYLNGPLFQPYLLDHDIFSARLGESLIWRASNKVTITQKLQITPNVQDFGDFRARFDLSLSYPLLKRITLSLNVFDEYESRPAATVDKNQLQVQSTVGVTF